MVFAPALRRSGRHRLGRARRRRQRGACSSTPIRPSVDITQPINQMPPTWKSKFPIYYAFAGVSSLSGLATWQVLAPLAAALLAMAAIGLLPRRARGVRRPAGRSSLVAMAIAGARPDGAAHGPQPLLQPDLGLLRHAVHAGPRLVGGAARARAPRPPGARSSCWPCSGWCWCSPTRWPRRSRRCRSWCSLWIERRRRIAAGERRLPTARSLSRPPQPDLDRAASRCCSRFPSIGVATRRSGARSRAPARPLASGLGRRPRPLHPLQLLPLAAQLAGSAPCCWSAILAARGARGCAPPHRGAGLGLGGLLVLGLLLGIYFRQRAFGYYFEFKLLAFIGPLLLLLRRGRRRCGFGAGPVP